MVVVNSQNFYNQYKSILSGLYNEDIEEAKRFKIHLDTVLLNMHQNMVNTRDLSISMMTT